MTGPTRIAKAGNHFNGDGDEVSDSTRRGNLSKGARGGFHFKEGVGYKARSTIVKQPSFQVKTLSRKVKGLGLSQRVTM